MSSTRSRIWLACVVALIIGASSCSSVALPGVIGIDKLGHFALFGLLATHLHLSGLAGRRLWVALLLCSTFGMLDEVHQSFTPGRSVDLLDWLADSSGAALALVLYGNWTSYRRLLEFRLL
jgi:VanZ family protein